jgi:hypothetical protein
MNETVNERSERKDRRDRIVRVNMLEEYVPDQKTEISQRKEDNENKKEPEKQYRILKREKVNQNDNQSDKAKSKDILKDIIAVIEARENEKKAIDEKAKNAVSSIEINCLTVDHQPEEKSRGEERRANEVAAITKGRTEKTDEQATADFELKYKESIEKLKNNPDASASEILDSKSLIEFANSNTVGQRPFLACKVEGINMNALLDTGSSVNVISGIMLRKIETAKRIKFPRIPTNILLCTYGGRDLGQKGLVMLEVTIGNEKFSALFVVADVATSDCLFGTPILIKQRISILSNQRELNAAKGDEYVRGSLSVRDPVTLQAGETKLVKLSLGDNHAERQKKEVGVVYNLNNQELRHYDRGWTRGCGKRGS